MSAERGGEWLVVWVMCPDVQLRILCCWSACIRSLGVSGYPHDAIQWFTALPVTIDSRVRGSDWRATTAKGQRLRLESKSLLQHVAFKHLCHGCTVLQACQRTCRCATRSPLFRMPTRPLPF